MKKSLLKDLIIRVIGSSSDRQYVFDSFCEIHDISGWVKEGARQYLNDNFKYDLK